MCVSVWSSGRVALSVCFCAGVCVRGGGGGVCVCVGVSVWCLAFHSTLCVFIVR